MLFSAINLKKKKMVLIIFLAVEASQITIPVLLFSVTGMKMEAKKVQNILKIVHLT